MGSCFAQRVAPTASATSSNPGKASSKAGSTASAKVPGPQEVQARAGLASPGESLSANELQAAAGFRFDFSRVRIHSDGPAVQSARTMGARGYTLGNHIVLGRRGDESLLRHELAHVVQQTAPDRGSMGLASSAEAEAERAGAGGAGFDVRGRRPLEIARAPGPKAQGPLPGEHPLSEMELFNILARERAFTFSPGGAPVEDPAGIGRDVGAEAGGREAGDSVIAIVQVTDRNGNLVDRSVGKYLESKDRHAEDQALRGLEMRIAGRDVSGGEMLVVVDQNPCPPDREHCSLLLEEFAARHQLRKKVRIPARRNASGKSLKPKTAARTSMRTDVDAPRLEDFVPGPEHEHPLVTKPAAKPAKPAKPAAKAAPSAGSKPATEPMRKPAGGGQRSTVSATSKGYTQHKPSEPEVIVSRRAPALKNAEPPKAEASEAPHVAAPAGEPPATKGVVTEGEAAPKGIEMPKAPAVGEGAKPVEAPNMEAPATPHVAAPEGDLTVPKNMAPEGHVPMPRSGKIAVGASTLIGLVLMLGPFLPDVAGKQELDAKFNEAIGSEETQKKLRALQPELEKLSGNQYYNITYRLHYTIQTSPKPQTFSGSTTLNSVEILDIRLSASSTESSGEMSPRDKPSDAKPVMGGGWYWPAQLDGVASSRVESGGQARERKEAEARAKEKSRLIEKLQEQEKQRPQPAKKDQPKASGPPAPAGPSLAPLPSQEPAAGPAQGIFLPGQQKPGPIEEAAQYVRNAQAWTQKLLARGNRLEERTGSDHSPSEKARSSFIAEETSWRTTMEYLKLKFKDDSRGEAVTAIGELLDSAGPRLKEIRIHLGGSEKD